MVVVMMVMTIMMLNICIKGEGKIFMPLSLQMLPLVQLTLTKCGLCVGQGLQKGIRDYSQRKTIQVGWEGHRRHRGGLGSCHSATGI